MGTPPGRDGHYRGAGEVKVKDIARIRMVVTIAYGTSRAASLRRDSCLELLQGGPPWGGTPYRGAGEVQYIARLLMVVTRAFEDSVFAV